MPFLAWGCWRFGLEWGCFVWFHNKRGLQGVGSREWSDMDVQRLWAAGCVRRLGFLEPVLLTLARLRGILGVCHKICL